MAYVRVVLSGLAATVVALLGPEFVIALRGMNQGKATGLAGLWVSVFSPWFWILAASFFGLFFSASRLRNKALRVALFWAPTVIVSALGFGLVALFAYAWLHFRKG
jgi:hypothetical protein